MTRKTAKNTDDSPAPLLSHGGKVLSLVVVDAYNAEMRSPEGFLGDRASRRAFQAILDDWRDRVSRAGDDPLGDLPSEEISKKQLDKMLAEGDAEAAGVIHADLIGCIQLVPSWILAGHDSILAVDIGGSNIRAGIVELRRKRSAGSIERGGQNLPGDWEHKSFNLPAKLRAAIPRIGDHETVIVMHNDAVVQGLSEVPGMRDYEHWGVLTIGTGLGNARFTNRQDEEEGREDEEEDEEEDEAEASDEEE